jgi:hypothetical protein
LINQMRALNYPAVYVTACRLAATTGLRLGEVRTEPARPDDVGGGMTDSARERLRVGDLSVYCLPPVYWWDGWTPLTSAVGIPEGPLETSRLLVEMAIKAATLLTRTGWEGDGNWYVSALPTFDDGVQAIRFLIAVRQWNNGTTFLCSPEPLLWLAEYLCP